ncbi:MAG TPA: OPT/YSL family transporter, partial [Gemmataceae bacterium]|nr:OPT/YSL family transporter [Gemmataceae bacterium]
MNHESLPVPEDSSARLARPKPPGLREFSPRAIICGLFVAVLMGASYPYVVLKLGFGPNVSVVAAILGYLVLGLLFTRVVRFLGFRYAPYNRWENNIVQTAGTAAAQTAFMCILLAAFDMLTESQSVQFTARLTEVQSFAWLTSAGLLGVLLAVPLRRHYIVDEKLPFPDGLAAGETILICDSEGRTATRAAIAMVAGIVASGVLMTLTEDSHVFRMFPSTFLPFSAAMLRTTGVGLEWSLLAVGSGMIIGMRINISMLVGTILSWVVAPYFLRQAGILGENFKRVDVLFWVMWPATGMLVAGGLAGLFLRWRVLAKTFQNLSSTKAGADEFPLTWVAAGALLSGGALVAVQKIMLGQPIWITVIAVLLSVPLALVGLRVLGETNWGPISALANLMQGIFAILVPGNIAANMVASGTTGTIATESEAIMQDYKAGDMVGSSPRYLTYMQLLATPVGAAAVSWMYPVLRAQYGIGGETGLSSPTSRRWAGFAEILSKGFDALPRGAMVALVVASLVGIVLAILEIRIRNKMLIPSPTGLGIGMLVP